MKQKNIFSKIEYHKFYAFGSGPARTYGTPKMHKHSSSNSFLKLSSVVSSLGTFNYNIACYLRDLYLPLCPNDYSWEDTFSLVS